MSRVSRKLAFLPLLAVPAFFSASCQMDPAPPSSEAESAQVLIGGVRWYVDYEAAQEVARREQKALWVHFGENPG
ncbi:MAG: hypothetical protein AAF682_04755 [Planctomycetota bacterium]